MSAAPPAAAAPAAPARRPLPRLARRLLSVPLFYKILLGNLVIVELGVMMGVLAGRSSAHEGVLVTLEMWLLVTVVVLLLTTAVNVVILRFALQPLRMLEQTAERVHAGDLDARVPPSPLADAELRRLTRTFDAMLDAVAAYRQRLRDVAARALNAEEEERKRIARELHDETAQTLAALLIRLRLVRGMTDPAEKDRTLNEIRDSVGEAIEGVRRFARGLRPPALDELGLVPAVESHARGLTENTGVVIRIQAQPVDGLLTPQSELALYRIIQEALSNTVRHARARSVKVRIEPEDGRVVAEIRDDGVGFDVDATLQDDGRGLGLFGMRERAAYVDGSVSIHSRRGSGTMVRAEIPTAQARLGRLGERQGVH
jgi:two-component system, NarL family, sensor histidine kinase UhpB